MDTLVVEAWGLRKEYRSVRGRTRGRTASTLLAGGAEQRIVVADPERARDVLAAAGVRTRREGDRALMGAAGTPPERVTELLGREGLWVRELSPVRRDLESV